MRDFLLIMPEDQENKTWYLDINVVNGYPQYVGTDGQTNDQRAAVSTVMSTGTFPGKLDSGVDWEKTLSQEDTLVDLDNQVKRNVRNNAAIEGTTTSTYNPLYLRGKDGGIEVIVVRS